MPCDSSAMNSQLVERMLNIPAITADVPMRWEDRSTDKYGLAQTKKTITYSPLPLRAVSQPAQPVQGAGADAVDGAGLAAEGLAEILRSKSFPKLQSFTRDDYLGQVFSR